MTVPAFYIGSRSINYLLQGDTGQKALVIAKLENESVKSISIVNAGRGYYGVPSLKISPSKNNNPAEGTVVIGEGVVSAGRAAQICRRGVSSPAAGDVCAGEDEHFLSFAWARLNKFDVFSRSCSRFVILSCAIAERARLVRARRGARGLG